MRALVKLAVLAIVVLGGTPAHAHVESASATGLVAGLSHPISGVDHVLAMVSVGLWGAQLGTPALWALPVIFPMVMALGGFLALVGVSLPGVEIAIALSALSLGVCVALELRPPLLVAGALVAGFAVFHGHAHGTELPPGESGWLYSIGFVVATGCLHACGIALGLVYRWPLGRVAIRAAGTVVAAGGCVFLWRAVA
jgi:urease accessory protein